MSKASVRNKFFIMGLIAAALVVISGLIAGAEFILVPKILGYPRELLLMRYVSPPGINIDGQLINSMGFTGDVITPEKPQGTIRILVLGGSVMFNRHLGERLKESLQQKSARKIELVDAGVRSHSSRSDLYKMQRLANYNFDYVIYYNGVNDLLMNAKSPMDFQEDYSHYSPWLRQNALFKHSVLAFFIYKLYWDAYNSYYSERKSKADFNYYQYKSIQTFRNNVTEIVKITKAHGGVPVLMTFAYAIPENYTQKAFNKDLLGYVNPEHYDRWPVEGWGSVNYVREGLGRINEVLRDLSATENLVLIDTDALLTNRINFFGDFCHYNDTGVNAFVNIVTDRFRKESWLD